MLRIAVVVMAMTFGGLMTSSVAADAARTWKTERATFLDSPEFMATIVRLTNGAIPGTNKPYDAHKVADELTELLFAELADEKGVHVETLMVTLGALAGFSVQMALREGLVRPGITPEDQVFGVIETRTGEKLYSGGLTLSGLYGGKPGSYSVFDIVGGGALKAGAKELPDLKDIVSHVADTMGSDQFGIPRAPTKNKPHARPIELLNKFWNPIRNHLALSVESPAQWPLVLSLVSQKTIIGVKDVLDPKLAATLVMESAAAMAIIDPKKIHYAHIGAN